MAKAVHNKSLRQIIEQFRGPQIFTVHIIAEEPGFFRHQKGFVHFFGGLNLLGFHISASRDIRLSEVLRKKKQHASPPTPKVA